ncbi:MAG: ribbon-helix-helix protein, CopG family [Gammaproteobacteria bacterium]|nr:ribbon-helix-helix protein, CopG family [Gammaproteobacteria bacterium]
MRTTLTLDESIMAELKRRAHESGRSFKEVVNEVLRAGLEQAEGPPARRPYDVPTARMGSPGPGIDLNKAASLAGALEDAELVRKMELRK